MASDSGFSEASVKKIAIAYATRDGQSERIAQRIAARLGDKGTTTEISPLSRGAPPKIEAHSDANIAVLPVRYGRVLPEGQTFLAAYAIREDVPPLALAVVNLVARDPSRRTPETNPYLRKALARSGLQPALATAFAGRLNYPIYGFVDKQMIRLIMAMTGGVADGRSDIEYTDWAQVDEFATAVMALAERSRRSAQDFSGPGPIRG